MNGVITTDGFLSPHFQKIEFEPDGPMPDLCIPSYTQLCLLILEPIREQFGPLTITSGYRNVQTNQRVGGVQHSQHDATDRYCAADWWCPTYESSRRIFDWIRLTSRLPIDQLILEHPIHGQDIIHSSWVIAGPRYMAMEGATGNRTGYMSWPFIKPLPETAPPVVS